MNELETLLTVCPCCSGPALQTTHPPRQDGGTGCFTYQVVADNHAADNLERTGTHFSRAGATGLFGAHSPYSRPDNRRAT